MMYSSFTTLIAAALVLTPFAFEWWVNHRKNLKIVNINKASSLVLLMVFTIIPLTAEYFPEQDTFGGIFGAATTSILLQLWFHNRRTQKYRGVEITPQERFLSSFRSLLGLTLIYGVYITIVLVAGARFSTTLSVPMGLFALYTSSPLLLRVMWKTSPIQDPKITKTVMDVFNRAHVKVKKLYFIEASKLKFHNAMVCGPTWGFGPFQRSLFITRSLFENLDPAEVHAVLLHEASHFKLNHIPKRMGAGLIGVFISLIFMTLVSTLNFLVFKHTLSMLIGFACIFLIQCPFVSFVARKHEFEADLEAVKLGASSAALISALKKITTMSGLKPNHKTDSLTRAIFGIIHPSIAEREVMLKRGYINSKNREQPVSRYAYTLAILLAIQFSMSYFIPSPPHSSTAQRSVAGTDR